MIDANAMHNLPYVLTGGTAIGAFPTPISSNKRKSGQRGKDNQQRRPNGGQYASECAGRGKGGTIHCEYASIMLLLFKGFIFHLLAIACLVYLIM